MTRAVHLLVRSPFGGHAEGHRITDPAEVEAVLAGPHALHVLQTPAEPDPERRARAADTKPATGKASKE